MQPRVRFATESDASAILEIYSPIVLNTATSFEVEPPSEQEMRTRITETMIDYPWLVCEGDRILGYAYASKHRVRPAYKWSVDVSVYAHQPAQRRGIGRALYTALFQMIKLQGYCNAFAGITLPNPASVGLHESLGFTLIGIYKSVGYKLGSWHDVGWWQLRLKNSLEPPEKLKKLSEVKDTDQFQFAISKGESLIKSTN
ncbi:MAG TPA: arsinothricin resistance N-acetyltransferase ArsN1 family B [Blastocatellia bacterium]|nr:arsinothricin resistance N-acetyltransferase ArsN1 family B [Blastocatellia bacterium]